MIAVNDEGSDRVGAFAVYETIVQERSGSWPATVVHESGKQALGDGKSVYNQQVCFIQEVKKFGTVGVGVWGVVLRPLDGTDV